MAEPQRNANVQDELDDMAFKLYSERMAQPGARNAEQEAIHSYRNAENFLLVRKKIRAGDLKAKPPEGPQLADACCPNLDSTHPINLVAKVWTDRNGRTVNGDLAKVNRIYKWLHDHPTTEQNAEDLPQQLAREFRDLRDWNKDTIEVARQLFTAYCK